LYKLIQLIATFYTIYKISQVSQAIKENLIEAFQTWTWKIFFRKTRCWSIS